MEHQGKLKAGHGKFKLILISAGLWGLLAHGMALCNKYSFHDDATLFDVGATYSSGRWMLGFLDEYVIKLTGSPHYSLPLFNGLSVILFIGLACILLSDLLEIEDVAMNIGLAGIMMAFPVVTGLFGYNFTAPYYFFGTLCGVFGGCLLCRVSKWYSYIGGILLMASSVGVYQANLAVCVSLMLVYFIKITVNKENPEWKSFLRRLVYYGSACVSVLVTYLAINSIVIWYKHVELTDYRDIKNFGRTSIWGYWNRFVQTYKEFFNPTGDVSRNMFPFSLDVFYKIVVWGLIVLTAYLIYRKFREHFVSGVQIAFLVLFIPPAMNLVYIMCEPSEVHTLMMYGQIFCFFYFVWILDYLKRVSAIKWKRFSMRHLSLGGVFLLLLMDLMYCRFSNICYLKAEYMQNQAINYYTMLITQIKGAEGYTDETPVVYINEFNKTDRTIPDIPQFNQINIAPYGDSSLINDYLWKVTMRLWWYWILLAMKPYQKL